VSVVEWGRQMDLAAIHSLPNGARFYRCAFQVNTYEYVVRHNHPTSYATEDQYNAALVEACHENRIEVIALADHYRVRPAAKLIAAAQASGIIVFPGFEAVSREGVHLLCLFDPTATIDSVQGFIHACGVHDDSRPSPIGELDARQLLDRARTWPAQIIAAHIAGAGGLFRALQAGQARSAIWRDSNLLACSIAGPISAAPPELQPILQNTNHDYKRDRPVAVLNCQDVCGPEDLQKPGTSCFVKMTTPSLEGLRQAFLDPGSRIRLGSDPALEEHIELLGISWETEGFLRRGRIHFNENLNVLVGGRGSGKSTIIESIRYVLAMDPIGDDAKRVHDGIVKGVLRSGTKITLAVQSYQPDKRLFFIERTVPNPPRVVDSKGNVLAMQPANVLRGVCLFGQNELAELARSPDKLTALLHRFVPIDQAQDSQMQQLAKSLAATRRGILECKSTIQRDTEALAALSGIKEILKRYQDAGVEDKLQAQDQIIKAETIVETASATIAPFRDSSEQLEALFPVSQDFLAEPELKGLPAQIALEGLRAALTEFEDSAQKTLTALQTAIQKVSSAIASASATVAGEKAAALTDYERTLRDLQKARIDGAEFIRLRQEIARLTPLTNRLAKTEKTLRDEQQKRRNDLAAWEDLKRERHQRLVRAARKVSKELPNRLRVNVVFGGNRDPLINLLKQEVGGRLSESILALTDKADLSVAALADACRESGASLAKQFLIPQAQADRFAAAGSKLPLLIEELELPHTTDIELNVGPENAPPEWRKLDQLSTGQKATALLYLLLLDSEGPLVLDQPEDNLDNRFISEGVVPKIRNEKRRRQFIFSTHNANIPVLGDAELIIGMRAVGEAGDGHAEILPEQMGAIDKPSVAALVEEILEGGKEAFQTRRLKYGF